jgi:hypothetical protein
MHNIRRLVLGIAAGVAFTSFATAGFAAGPSEAEKRAACTNDVMQYCFSAIASMEKVESCLRAQKPRLSGTCKALFDKYEAIPSQPANSAGRSSAIETPVSERVAMVAQPATEEPATPAAPVEAARPPREAPAVVTPSTSEKTAAVPLPPAGTARSLGQTPAAIAPSTNEMALAARPCDMFDCSLLPAPMEKVMRNMPASMVKAMRNVPRAAEGH